MEKFRDELTGKSRLDESEIYEVKDAYYDISDGLYADLPILIKEHAEALKEIGINPKKEIKLFSDIKKLFDKSELGKVL